MLNTSTLAVSVNAAGWVFLAILAVSLIGFAVTSVMAYRLSRQNHALRAELGRRNSV